MSEVAARTPVQQTVAVLTSDAFRQEVQSTLPPGLSVDRFIAVARTAIMQTPELAECDQVSLFQSIKRCSQDGLMPDGREAAIVYYWSNKLKANTAQYLPMIGGLRKIAAEFGVSIATHAVYQQDGFSYELGVEPRITHVPARLGTPRGELLGAYAVATDRDGRQYIDVMGRDEIDAIRGRSRSKDKGPWVTDYQEMCKKTVGRRVFKQIPLLMEKVRDVIAASDADVILDDPVRPALVAPAMTVGADAAFDDGYPAGTGDAGSGSAGARQEPPGSPEFQGSEGQPAGRLAGEASDPAVEAPTSPAAGSPSRPSDDDAPTEGEAVPGEKSPFEPPPSARRSRQTSEHRDPQA